MTTFRDRSDAGRAVARRLAGMSMAEPLVLGLARGGVPVAAEVAAALAAPLDVLVVRKVGHPEQPEYALGAVTADGTVLLRHRVPGVERAAADAAAMERRLRDGRPAPQVAGRDVVLVDDGLATGATMVAAARAMRRAGCGRLVVAVPVGPADTVRALRGEADEVVCALVPRDLVAVGRWYDDFHQVTDDEVRALIAPG